MDPYTPVSARPSTFQRRPVLAWGLVAGGVAAVCLVVVVVAIVAVVVLRTWSGSTTTITIGATGPSGEQPDARTLNTAGQVLTHRLEAAGFDDADVVVNDGGLVVTVGGQPARETIVTLLEPGHVSFRKVINVVPDLSGSSRPWPGSTEPVTRDHVYAKLGPASVAAATQIGLDGTSNADAVSMAVLEPFARLTPTEVASLPAELQFTVPQISCATLNARPGNSFADVTQRVVACAERGEEKMFLDAAKVVGSDVGNASVAIDSDGTWIVKLTFDAAGAAKWTALTREAFTNEGGRCLNGQAGVSVAALCQVAIVRDARVISAPTIRGVLGAESQITGSFARTDASLLAAQLSYGAIPLQLTIVSMS